MLQYTKSNKEKTEHTIMINLKKSMISPYVITFDDSFEIMI